MLGANYYNESAPIVAEYYDRLELAKLGYTDSLDSLDCHTANCFAIIRNKSIEVQNKKQKEQAQRARANKPRIRRR